MFKLKLLTSYLLLVLLIGCGNHVETWPEISFDQKKWMQANENNRYVYVKNLIKSERLKGLSKSEVVKILGSPSYENESEIYITYVVKADSAVVYILDIRFNESGSKRIVTDVFVRSD